MSRPAGERRTVFEPRTVAAMVVAGLVAFGLFLVLLAYADDLSPRGDGRGHAMSSSAIGCRGPVRLVALGGGNPQMARSDEQQMTEDLLVGIVEERAQPETLRALLARRATLPTLVVLPKWDVIPDRERPGWVHLLGPLPPQALAPRLEALGELEIDRRRAPSRTAEGLDFLGKIRMPAPEMVQTVSGGNLTPLVAAGADSVLVAQLPDAPHYVVADPDLLNNHGLADAERARAELALLAQLNSTGAATVSFDLLLNGLGRQRNALQLAFEPPFLPLALILVVAAILAGLHGAARFGPAAEEAPAPPFGKSALVENSATLLRMARREPATGGAYAALVREAAARDSGAHLALSGSELDDYPDRASPAARPPCSALARPARRADGRNDLVAAARALFQWKKDLLK